MFPNVGILFCTMYIRRAALRGLGRLGMLVGVLQIHLGFLFGTLSLRLPFATEFVADQVIGSQIGPLGARKLLDDLLHVLFVDRDVQCRIAHFRRGTGGPVFRLDLPADVGAAIKRFSGQRGSWEIFGDACVDSHGVLRRSAPAATPAGFHLGIESLAE